ncbi:MAG: type III-A CRISPR-associated RAMP protein Csm5 [Desulfobulbaceae bacterium A2]|nr:MAG: type III-A CRISPR-associated RAMP protein Csm5 [Desulfobulbaceae bacterium A2]
MVPRTVDFKNPKNNSQPQAAPASPHNAHTLYCRIKNVSPLHIGCDEVYEPTGFVVDEQSGELVSFATISLLELLDVKALKKFSAICAKGTIVSMLELLKFMQSQAGVVRDHGLGQRIKVSEDFVGHLKSTLNLPANERTVQQELNSFQIRRTAFDPLTDKAYIPGSAIKGAIRTAVLNLRNGGKKEPHFGGRHASRELQEHILGFDFHHLESDPFRLLKVSDFFPLNEPARKIVYAVDRKKRPSERESQAPYQILETVEAGAVFAGTITLLPAPAGNSGIKNPLGVDEIVKAIRSFFCAEKQREDQELGKINVQPAKLAMTDTTLPLRIGRHSGAECVTVTGHRNIKIMQGRNNPDKYLDHATTIWLSANAKQPATNQGMKPYGWVAMEELAETEGRRLLDEIGQDKQSVFQSMQGRIAAMKQREAEIEAAKLQAKELELRLAEKKAAQAAEAEQERQRLAAMTEIERLAFAISKPGGTEESINSIFKKIDTLSPDEQLILATAFRDRWQADGKWIKHQCTSAQWEKVKRLKSILEPAGPQPNLSLEEQSVITKIEELKDWGAWKDAHISIDTLSLSVLLALKEKFHAWRIKEVKGGKKDTWKALEKRIKELKNV